MGGYDWRQHVRASDDPKVQNRIRQQIEDFINDPQRVHFSIFLKNIRGPPVQIAKESTDGEGKIVGCPITREGRALSTETRESAAG